VRHRQSEILRDFASAFLLCLFLFAAKELFVEHTLAGQVFEEASYQLLQHRLTETLGQFDDVPVTVVDISPLQQQDVEPGLGGGQATPAKDLLELLQTIASAHPKAIGIDIDLSPEGSVDIAPGALELFKGAEQIKEQLGITVAIGVHRTEAGPRELRLGFPRYSDLAASIAIPRRDLTEVRVMARSIVPMHNGAPDKDDRIESMSAVLASALQTTQDTSAMGALIRSGILRKTEIVDKPGLQADEFLVDFSPAKLLIENRVVAKTPADIARQAHRFAGRIVLLGDGDPEKTAASDSYLIPGQPVGQLTPGVYVHACAAYTLSRAPLFEFTGMGRLLADLVLFLIAFAPLCIWRLRRSPDESQVRTREFLLALLSVLILIAFAHTLVRTTRILWTDFSVGVVAIILHVAARDLSGIFVHWAESHVSLMWRGRAKGGR
jgi:CHASE2 domain-containing sensor protein